MFEAYSVAIRLKLIENVSMGLIGLSSHFRGLNSDVIATQKGLAGIEERLKSIKTLGLVGGIAMGAGAFGLSLFDAPIKAARDYDLAFTKFKNLNLGDAINKQADQFARGANVMGVSGKELMQTLTETVGIFGSFDMARQLAPTIAAINQANAAVYKGKIEGIDEGSARSLMQFIDRRGGTKSPEAARDAMDLAEKLVTGTGGFIQFKDLAAFSQMGGTAFRALSDQGVLDSAYLMEEQGGARAGTAMMSIYQNLIAGRTTKKAMGELAYYGVGHVGSIETGSVGGKKIKSNALVDVPQIDLLASDGPTWFRTVLLPLLAAKGVTQEKDILRITNDLLSNRNASGQASIMDTQTFQVLREAKLAGNAKGVDDVIKTYKADPNSQFSELSARWTDTLRDLGLVTLPAVVKGTEKLNSSLKGITEFETKHPNAMTWIAGLVAGTATLSVVGGTLMLATAGLSALGLVLTMGQGAGIGTMLTSTASGIGALGLQLAKAGIGKIAAVSAAGFAGYEVGKYLNSLGPDGDLGGYLAGKLYETIHPYDPNARAAATTSGISRHIAPKVAQSPTVVNTQINMDGRKVAEAVTVHLTKALSAPLGGSDYDSTLTMPSVLINQAR